MQAHSLGELVAVRSAVLEPAETISGHRVQTVGILYRGTITGGALRDGEYRWANDEMAHWASQNRRLELIEAEARGAERAARPCERRMHDSRNGVNLRRSVDH